MRPGRAPPAPPCTDDSDRSISYAYDSNDNLVSFVDTLGQTTTYSYDTPGRMTGIVYPWTSGQPFVTNTYDSLGRVKTQTNVLGAAWQYFLAGTRSEEVDPYGMRHALYSTPHGKTRTEIQDLGGASQTVTTSTYDALGRLTLATAPEGNTVGYTYDLASNVLTITRTPKPGSALSPLVTTTTYEPTFNKPLTITDPRGLVTAMTYEPGTGNLRSVVADSATLKATTRYTYDGNGQLLATTDPVGTVTANSYDGSGNLVSTVRDSGPGRLNLTTTFTYNARGDPLTVTDPRGSVTTNAYDAARRVETTTTPATAAAPAGIVTAYTYDLAGRVTQTQQTASGTVLRTTSATYTLSGKPTTATDPNGNVTRYAYDLLDRRTAVTDAMKRVTQYGYDALSRVTQVSNPAASASPLAQQAFTANGLRASLTDANSHTTGFAYDGLDRLDTTTYPNSSTETLAYDADSNVTTRGTRAGQSIAYAYDTLNRLITKTPPSPWPTVTYTYDLAGRLKGTSDNSSSIAAAAPPGGAASVEYATTYSYDALNRPVGVSWTPAPTTTAPSSASSVLFGHSYNAVNQRIGQTASDNTWIDYPSSTGATSYTANNLNQYTAVGAVTPTYDGNGNLTADGTNTLSHDPENRLVSASATGMTATYAFDGRGRRKHKTVNGTTTISITDADNREVLEYDGSTGAILRWYAYGLGPNELLSQVNVSASTRATPVPDMLGSIVGMLDGSTGNLSPFGYHPYGTSASAPSQFGYTGQRVDIESGLYYYRARHYFPKWGRFLQSDPLGYTGGMHLYGYVGNDPLNLLDPQGLLLEAIGDAALNLAGTMVRPYVDFYNNSVVAPFRAGLTWLAGTPAGDPGLWASLQGLGPPGAMAGGIGSTFAVGLRALVGIGTVAEEAAVGGRLGGAATRALNASIAADLESRNYAIIGGGGRLPEEYIPGAGPRMQGSTFVDITARHRSTGEVLRTQTIDTLANGNPTAREAAAAARIQSAYPNDALQLIPKR